MSPNLFQPLLEGRTQNSPLNGVVRNGRKETGHRNKRMKYIARACQDCQRRKVKCSGDDVCLHCRARDIQCIYLPKLDNGNNEGRRKRVRTAKDSHIMNHDIVEIVDQDEAQINSGTENRSNGMSLPDRISCFEAEMKRVSRGDPARRLSNPNNTTSATDQSERLTFSNPVGYMVESPQSFGEETDTFESNACAVKNLSLSSQLASLRELLRLGSDSPVPSIQTQFRDRVFPLELPRPSRLRHLLDVYFRDMDSFFPYLDQKETERRISQALKILGYSEYEHIIDVDFQCHSIMALLCNMLVMGECLDPDEKHSEDSRPGWTLFARGRKLIQHCSSSKTTDLDLVRYHTLSAMYLMHSELLQSASQAISTAIQLAMVLGLNDQATWGDRTPEEVQARQRLWWTIYYLDRKIGQRSGNAYLIRDNEVALEDFEKQKRQNASLSPDLPWTNDYLQALINLGKLWGQIWDTSFAALAPKRGDWQEVDIADTRILLVRRQLPPGLTWDTEMLAIYIEDGETEPQIRRRLAIFIRINLLRMLIRQNPLSPPDSGPGPSSNSTPKSLCALLATHTISAITAFTATFPRFRPSGYFITTALVECIYHLVHVLQDPSLEANRASALDSFRTAYNLLLEFAQTLNSARRAVRALRTAIFSGTGPTSPFEAITAAPGSDERGVNATRSSGDERVDSRESEEYSLAIARGQQQNQKQAQPQNQHPRPPLITFDPLVSSIPAAHISQSSHLLPADEEIQIDMEPPQLDAEQQVFRSVDHQGFIQDLADCYGDLDFDGME